ncbi:MAG TPA: hypothetical protein PKC45_15245 [Gemmatales bacterium]|nr:hypothetical protein [Gemmatales bacterium]
MPELLEPHHETIITGLLRAVAAPRQQPLLASRQGAGLFPATAAGRQAAQAAVAAGLIQTQATPARGKSAATWASLSPAGLDYLSQHAHPRDLVRQVVQALEARGQELLRLQAAVEKLRSETAAWEQTLTPILSATLARLPAAFGLPETTSHGEPHLRNGQPSHATLQPQPLAETLLHYLAGWQSKHGGGDCPLPELWHAGQRLEPTLTLGTFHDLVRGWRAAGRVHLHPWTGPLHELPEPGVALLVGHAVIYYISRR